MQISAVMTELGEALRNQRLRLDGTAGTFVSAPDHNRLDITGDIDIRCRLAMDDWTPPAGDFNTLVAKREATGQMSYYLRVDPGGVVTMGWSEDGTAELNETSSTIPGFTDGTTHWVRSTLDVDNGAGDAEVMFFTSEDGILWTQLGVTRLVGTTTSIFDSTSQLEVGSILGGTTHLFTGDVFAVEVHAGLSILDPRATPRFDDGTEWQLGSASSRDDQDNLWTLQGNATIEEEGIAGLRVYDWLVDNAQIPAAIIGLPRNYTFDASLNRGVDMLEIPVYVVVGRITDRSSRDNMSAFVDGDGPSSLKETLEAATYTSFSSIRVANVTFDTISLAGIEVLAATFQVDIWGPGT